MIFFQHKRIIYSLICLSLWCIIGCASVGNPPSGGRKDTTPPVLDTAKSSPILPLNTKPQKLVFYFDEYIEVRNYSKKLIVSPPLVYNPIVKYRGKKVEVFLDAKEVLKENATYTFNFSDAIVDFHESNPYKNFTYVFSTGPTIDSLSIIGSVMDAKTGEAVKDISILLFDQLSDSAIAQVKPFYSTKTDDKGLFSLSYLRQDTFRIIALKDGNANYIYDVESEWIGFLDTLVMTKYNDSTSYDIRISPTDIPAKLKSSDTKQYGKIQLLYTGKLDTIPMYNLSDSLRIKHKAKAVGDSLHIWYDTPLDSFTLAISQDTIKVKPRQKNDELEKNKMKIVRNTGGQGFHWKDTLHLTWNYPIDTVDYNKIYLRDSIGTIEPKWQSITHDQMGIKIFHPWQKGKEYSVVIDSAAVTSWYNNTNDSLTFDIDVLKEEATSGLDITVKDLDSSSVFLINIYKDEDLFDRHIVTGRDSINLTYIQLKPDRYNVEVINDTNRDMKWTTGSYWLNRQPEFHTIVKGDKLKENRTGSIVVSWKEQVKQKRDGNGQKSFSNSLNIRK